MLKHYWKKVIYGILLFLCIGVATYFSLKVHEQRALLELDETTRLTMIIGQSMELPENETPLIATVTAREKLDRRVFPAKVMNGDKLIIYRVNGRVILFRPSTGKVIDSSSLPPEVMLEGGSEMSGQGKIAPTLSVSIATDDVAWVAEVEQKLQKEFPYLVVESRENAHYRVYQGVFIFNPSYFQSELAERMAEVFGGVFEETLPIGEKVPSTDLLLIIGEKGGAAQ